MKRSNACPRCRRRHCWRRLKVTTCCRRSFSCRRGVAAIKPRQKLHSRGAIPNDSRREARRDFMRAFVMQHAEVRGHRHWDTIIRAGVASHHAGHIPAWKLVIEKLMSAGLLDAIFATATVAAGVDFPGAHVVLTGADARTASGWRPLSASELAADDRTRRASRERQCRLCRRCARTAPGSGTHRTAFESATGCASQSISRDLHDAAQSARCLRKFCVSARNCSDAVLRIATSALPDSSTRAKPR